MEYVHKYMGTHLDDKGVETGKLKDNPIPSNLRQAPKLDGYIRTILQSNSKFITLKHEKTWHLIQEKLLKVFGPLSQLWVAMDNEKEQYPEYENINSALTFFDQSVMLKAQIFNSLSYHRRENILSVAMDSPARVKEILKN